MKSWKSKALKRMNRALQALLLGALVFSVIQAEAEDEVKTVCTMTISSSNEKNVFKKNLQSDGKSKSDKFKFVELVPGHPDSITTESDEAEEWFSQACEKKIQCDILLVSGHFAGSFFSMKSPYSLALETMEQKACSNSCAGILQKPKAVYLFGCNTLANKNKDHRTEQQYIDVLLRDGFGRSEAERLAQSRYGVFGDSFGDRMQRVFYGEKIIYGFDSVGPAGSTIQRPLEYYFNRLSRPVGNFLQKMNHPRVDLDFLSALERSAVTYAEGLKETDKLFQPSMQMCKMQLQETPVEEKLKLANQFLSSDYRSLALPQVMSLFTNYRDLNPKRFSTEEREALKLLTNNTQARQTLIETAFKLTASPVLQAQTFLWFYKVGWFSEAEFKTAMNDLLNKLVLSKSAANAEVAKEIFQTSLQTKLHFQLREDFKLSTPLSQVDLEYLKIFTLSPALREKVLDLLAAESVENRNSINAHLVKTVQGGLAALPLTDLRKQVFAAKSVKFMDLFRSSYEGLETLMREKILTEISALNGEALVRKVCTQEAKKLFSGSLSPALLQPLRDQPLQLLTAAECVKIKPSLAADSDWLVPAVLEAYQQGKLVPYKAVELLDGLSIPKSLQSSPVLKEILYKSKTAQMNDILQKFVFEDFSVLAKTKNFKAMGSFCEEYGKVVPDLFNKLQPAQFRLRLNLKDPSQYPVLQCFQFQQFEHWRTLVEAYQKSDKTKAIYSEDQMQKKIFSRFNLNLNNTLFMQLIGYAHGQTAVKAVITELRYTQNSEQFAPWLVGVAANFSQFEKRLWFYQAMNVTGKARERIYIQDREFLGYLSQNWKEFDDTSIRRYAGLLPYMLIDSVQWEKFVFGTTKTELVFNSLDPDSKLKVCLSLLQDHLPLSEKTFLLEKFMALSPDVAAQEQILAQLPITPENFRLIESYREQFRFESEKVRAYFE